MGCGFTLEEATRDLFAEASEIRDVLAGVAPKRLSQDALQLKKFISNLP